MAGDEGLLGKGPQAGGGLEMSTNSSPIRSHMPSGRRSGQGPGASVRLAGAGLSPLGQCFPSVFSTMTQIRTTFYTVNQHLFRDTCPYLKQEYKIILRTTHGACGYSARVRFLNNAGCNPPNSFSDPLTSSKPKFKKHCSWSRGQGAVPRFTFFWLGDSPQS